MSEQLKKPRVFIPVALFIVAALVALILTISPAPPRAVAAQQPGAGGVTANDVEMLMARIGATPETLAAAGLTAAEATAVVENTQAFLAGSAAALSTADDTLAQARSRYESLRRKARSGLADQGELNDLASAQQALFTARGALAGILDEAKEAAFAGLNDQQKGVLQSVENAAAQSSLGVALCAADRSESEWHEVRRAAGAIRAANYSGEEPDAEAVAALDHANSHAATVAARANIEVRLIGVTAAVATALGNV
ncbi:MAG: hypothetical protein H6812_10575 [Phycisphaeraceae bacterium]|nr:hypothetical protein [Phycisphaerales bacterium]MCB9843691.1 hypothetical protein [Phycisphaeraceae bacterium]